ncbi:DUF2252 family protein [Chamaesiphon sp. VAR_48_metabat_403]|uniref:DUF2252 domain-containing protein n=1 Tax=Chamaesiphon sp. VAR_48_metabat_403 TaxID=2964700 RepID=UPI00286DE9BB|nr:DUF2252 family protein [Chamaesiphon sp. VAR_48_metabat_403]
MISCGGNSLTDRQNTDIWELIQAFDRDRRPDLLDRKYSKMRKNALAFFRGSCHLFYRDLPKESSLNLAPPVWICGDLHLENFGAYKGEDRQIYFGINDFDESILAPCTWDVVRLVVSTLLAIDSLPFDRADGERLAQIYLTSYANTLSAGNISAIVEANARGIVANLLADLRRRKRSDLLDERTILNKERRQLKFDNEKILAISQERFKLVKEVIDNWAQTQAEPDFFKVLDIGFRVAGTGSLGLDRYIVLVAGKGSPDRNYLLDFKQQVISALQPYSIGNQPEWQHPAKRVMKVQQLVQLSPPALLAAIEFDDRSYLLRELQPTQDKIEIEPELISLEQMENLIDIMAEITAFTHLHGSGKLGAASAQALIDFGQNLDWQQQVLDYAVNYVSQVRLDFEYFCQASIDR